MSPIMKFNYTEFNGKLLSHFSFTYIKKDFFKRKRILVFQITPIQDCLLKLIEQKSMELLMIVKEGS